MSCNVTTPSPRRRAAARPRPTIGQIVVRLVDLIQTWLRRSAERRQLHSLGDHMLKDLGLSRADVERETSKRSWQE